MNYFLLVATVSLIVQLAVLAMLLAGYRLRKQEKFRMHAFVMLAALATHLAIVFYIMVPSFVVALIPISLEKPTSILGILSPIHAALGSAAAILGVWIMGIWRLRKTTEYCVPKRKVMRATYIVWVVSLGLGIVLYFVLNWTFLFG